MKVHNVLQRSETWFALRLGKLTASRVADAFATLKSKGEAADRRNLRIQLVLERMTGRNQENGYVSADMERGLEMEADALMAYEAETGLLLTPVGFCEHDTLMAGCSPDGFVGDGLLDIKCPKAATHLDYLRGELPSRYRLQLIHDLWITGRPWADFVSYAPDFPEPIRVKRTRLFAKDIDFAAHELNVKLFLSEVDREFAEVSGLAGAVA